MPSPPSTAVLVSDEELTAVHIIANDELPPMFADVCRMYASPEGEKQVGGRGLAARWRLWLAAWKHGQDQSLYWISGGSSRGVLNVTCVILLQVNR